MENWKTMHDQYRNLWLSNIWKYYGKTENTHAAHSSTSFGRADSAHGTENAEDAEKSSPYYDENGQLYSCFEIRDDGVYYKYAQGADTAKLFGVDKATASQMEAGWLERLGYTDMEQLTEGEALQMPSDVDVTVNAKYYDQVKEANQVVAAHGLETSKGEITKEFV